MKDCLQGQEDVKTMHGALVNLPRAMQHFLMKRSVCKVGYTLNAFTNRLRYIYFIQTRDWKLSIQSFKLLIGQDMQERNSFKCYCKHKNGRGADRSILCGLVEITNGTVVGDFQDISRCKYDEWCVGPSHEDESVQGLDYGRRILCTKGE